MQTRGKVGDTGKVSSMSAGTIRQSDAASKMLYDRGMEKHDSDARYLRLGRAMFGVYNVHSGGLAHDKEPVPSWTEIAAREHGQPATSIPVHLLARDDGVLAHWRHVASYVATSPEHAEAMARAIEDRHEDNAIFRRMIS